MAVSEPEMRKQMTLEDGLLQDFENMQREIEEYKQKNAYAEKATAEERHKTAEAILEIEELKKRLSALKQS